MKKQTQKWILIVLIIIIVYSGLEKKEMKKTAPFDTFTIRKDMYLNGNLDINKVTSDLNIWIINGDYFQYFMNNYNVKMKTIDTLGNKDFFWNYIDELETTGRITMQQPASMATATFYWVPFTGTETEQIRGAKIAHNIWSDKNNMFSWKLKDYNAEELNALFDINKLFLYSGGQYGMNSVIDYSPSDAYNYSLKHITLTKAETIYSVLTDLRTDYRHGGTNDLDRNLPYSLKQALTEYTGGFRVSRIGCQSMSPIVADILRSLNIPAYSENGWYTAPTAHSSTIIPNFGVLMHGDDVYTGSLESTPNQQLLMPWSQFAADVQPCGRYNGACSEYITHRFTSLNIVEYISSTTISICCNPANSNYVDCYDYLERGAGINGYLTPEEYNTAITNILSQCP